MAPKEINTLPESKVVLLSGSITCDSPNEFMDKFDGNVLVSTSGTTQEFIFNVGYSLQFTKVIYRSKSLLLRGCKLKNTEFCYGLVLYTGPESKIMMNSKKPPTKVSNMQRAMNKMLYSVFGFQLLLIFLYAILSIVWMKNNPNATQYLNISNSSGFVTFIIQYLTYWVAYSHLIPISLYVVLEIIKVG